MSEVVDLDRQLASIDKGSNKKSDALLLMTPDCNWGQFLQPAPYAVAILGEILLVSTETDFSLTDHLPAKGFKHIKFPDSFRASIVQVTNLGWDCFNTAHDNMDQIRLQCGNVDGHLINAVKFLLHGTPVEVEQILPMSLKKIQNIADQCFSLATQTERGFLDMMELIQELLESSTSVKGATEQRIKENETAIRVAKIERERLEKGVGDSEERLKRLQTEVKDAQSSFKDAMESIPSGGELLGLAAAEACVNSLRHILGSATKAACHKIEEKAGISTPSSSGSRPTYPNENNAVNLDQQISRQHIYTEVVTLHSYFLSLYRLTTRDPVPDWKQVQTNGEFLKLQFKTSLQNIEGEQKDAALWNRVSKLFNDCIAIAQELLDNSKKLSPQNEKAVVAKLVSKIKGIYSQEESLYVEARRHSGSNPLDTKSPHLSQHTTPGRKSIVDTTIENARYKTETAKETLRDAQRREGKAYDDLKEKNQKLTEVLTDMEKLKIDKIDFDTIRKTLIKGINALADLKAQWGKLVSFFELLTNIIKCCLSTSLTNFVDEAKIARKIKIGSKTMAISDVLRDTIFEQASKCSQISYVVYTVSNTYVKISEKHLIEKVTRLSTLIALDPKTQKQQINQQRIQLNWDCTTAQSDIAHLVADAKADFMGAVSDRIKQIQNLEKEFPPLDKKTEDEIKTSVTKGFDSTITDDYSGPSAEDLI